MEIYDEAEDIATQHIYNNKTCILEQILLEHDKLTSSKVHCQAPKSTQKRSCQVVGMKERKIII